MEMVGHHAKPFQHPVAFFARFKLTVLEGKMGTFVNEQILPIVPSIDDVVDTILPLDSQTSGHA